jgi:uncharacterized protein (DUF885 family)
VQFMLENTAMGEHDARTEVARYITWPGQATAYKVRHNYFVVLFCLLSRCDGNAVF